MFNRFLSEAPKRPVAPAVFAAGAFSPIDVNFNIDLDRSPKSASIIAPVEKKMKHQT
jgi:hypothetical protein